MMDQKYIELINKEIDGANSPGESADLRSYMAKNPEARRCYEELYSMARLMSEAPVLEPPHGLKQTILSALQPLPARGRKKGLMDPFVGAFRPKVRPKYAYVFAVGLVAGICLYALFARVSSSGNRLNLDELYGTIALGEAGARPASSIPLSIDLPGVRGSAQLQYFNNAILAKIDITSDRTIDIVFDYPSEVSFVLFRSLVGTDHDMHAEANRLTLTNNGVSDYILVFEQEERSKAPLQIGIYCDGKLLYEKTVNQGGKRG